MNYYELHKKWNLLIESNEDFSDPLDFVEALGLDNSRTMDSNLAELYEAIHTLIINPKAVAILTSGSSTGAYPKFEEVKEETVSKFLEILNEASNFMDFDFDQVRKRFLITTYFFSLPVLDALGMDVDFYDRSLYRTHVFSNKVGLAPLARKAVNKVKKDIKSITRTIEHASSRLKDYEYGDEYLHTARSRISGFKKERERMSVKLQDLEKFQNRLKAL